MNEYSIKELESILISLGLDSNSNILCHSSLIHLGKIKNIDIVDYPKKILEIFSKILAKTGTLIVPSSNFDYGIKKETHNVDNSPVSKSLGSFSNYVTFHSSSYRSLNPIFALSAIGKNSKDICLQSNALAFGEGSAWDILFTYKPKILYLGCGFEYTTFIRFIEFKYGVPYLYNKLFTTSVVRDNHKINYSVIAPLRYHHLNDQTIYDLSKFEQYLIEKKILIVKKFGETKIMLIDMHECFDEGIKCLDRDPHYFLAKKPSYNEKEYPLY